MRRRITRAECINSAYKTDWDTGMAEIQAHLLTVQWSRQCEPLPEPRVKRLMRHTSRQSSA